MATTPTPKPGQPAINTHVRLFDLVRYMRAELHDEGLITDAEYTWLSSGDPIVTSPDGGSPSPRRLEDYDDLQKKLTELQATNGYTRLLELRKENAELRAAILALPDLCPEDVSRNAIPTHKLIELIRAARALCHKS